MRESFCMTCNRVTPHSKRGCDVCKRTNEMDNPQKKEYLIPPTNEIKEENISGERKELTQNMGIRAEGFISPTHVTKAMSKPSTVDTKNMSKQQLQSIVDSLPANQKLRLFNAKQEEKPVPESMEKQDYVELKRTKKGATIVSYVNPNNYNYLTGHELMRYFKAQEDEEHPERTSRRGNMFVAEENIGKVIASFMDTGTPVFWRTREPATKDNIPSAE